VETNRENQSITAWISAMVVMGLESFGKRQKNFSKAKRHKTERGEQTKINLEVCASKAHIKPMPAETKQRREERLVARVSGADKELFRRAASLTGQSVATFVVAHAREVARRIVADYKTIELDAVQSRRFVNALLNPTPAAPNRVKRANSAYRQRVAA
jgi:uncharacterized protein (DUF1778 family)